MTPPAPEAKAREKIDRLLTVAGWQVCDFGDHDISKPLAIREFPLKPGHGHADYLLYLQGKAVGVVGSEIGEDLETPLEMYLIAENLEVNGDTGAAG